jgi:hypothetical protein
MAQYEHVQKLFKILTEKRDNYYLFKDVVNNEDIKDINNIIINFDAFKKAADNYREIYNTMLEKLKTELANANKQQELLQLLEHLRAKLSLAKIKAELAKETVYVQEYIITLDKINLQAAKDNELGEEIITKRQNKLDKDLENKITFIEEVEVAAKEREEVAEEVLVAAKEAKEAAEALAAEETVYGGGKRKSKGKSKKVAKKPVASQKKQSIYKEILGKQMKIYKMPDSRKEYVKYKGELLHISDYKDLMKQKAIAKTKTKVTKVTKVTQQKAKSKTKK